jgi:type IV secretory pathway VirJ component
MQESLFFGDVAMLVLVFLLVIMVPVRANAVEVETLQHDPFGSVEIFRSDSSEKGVVVFVSGAEGWTGALTALAQAVAELDYLVVGVDLRAWRLRIRKIQK